MTVNESENSQQNLDIMRKSSTGKIFKGTINDAPMKVRVASIPSKFQNVVYRDNKTPAFGNSRDRFYSHAENVRKSEPGPGNYEYTNKTQDKIFSKKGYGTLISKTKLDRLEKKYTGLPGPGSYNTNHTLLSKNKKSSSLALLSSKIQGHDLFRSELQKSKSIPGPGIYNLRLKRSVSQSHRFANNIDRFNNSIHNEQTPGVGHYRYEKSSLKPLNATSPRISYKKADHQHNDVSYQQKLKIVRDAVYSKTTGVDIEKTVGPGSYNTNIPNKKVGFKIHETSFDRFGDTINKRHSNLHNLFENNMSPSQAARLAQSEAILSRIIELKSSMKSMKGITSMFKSNISRYEFVQQNINDPGKYSPQKLDKKSHLVNFQNKWV